VDIAQHVAALRREGELLAEAAQRTDLDTPIPTTPEWSMRDLVRHMGDVHRWARTHVAEGRTLPIGRDELREIAGPLPHDADVLDWFRLGHDRLVQTLEAADPGIQCWAFLPAPSPLAFWARRQAHETGIHRADAESPTGNIRPFAPDVAVDGIDELLFGFFSGPKERSDEPPRTLQLHATDAEGDWVVEMGATGPAARLGRGRADCTVRGSASDLHLFLWNRRPAAGLDVHGDPSVLVSWRERAQIHWSRGR
jgi:uncharacterized protein (TIGR03083 family)